MLSPESIEHYRRMTLRERIQEMKELLEVAERAFRRLPPEELARRFAAADRIREASRQATLEALSKLVEQGGNAHRG